MLPKTKIVIYPDGNSKVEGMEQSDQCFKLKELSRQAGKVTEEKDKDHTPVYQDVNQKGA